MEEILSSDFRVTTARKLNHNFKLSQEGAVPSGTSRQILSWNEDGEAVAEAFTANHWSNFPDGAPTEGIWLAAYLPESTEVMGFGEVSMMPDENTIPIRTSENEFFTGGRIKANPGTDPDDCVIKIQLDTALNQVLGAGQTWKNLTASRVRNTAYRNTTGKPIQVHINHDSVTGGTIEVSTNSVAWIPVGISLVSGAGQSISFIVPDNHYYRTGGGIQHWAELS